MASSGHFNEINFLRKLIETGHAILAEIFRLAEGVPNDFKDPSSSRFRPFIVDFSYFEDLAVIDRFVDSNEHGAQLEDEYLITFERVINSFGVLFDAVGHFLVDMIEYSNDRCSNVVLPLCSTAAFAVLRQYEAEALYIAGVILLALEEKFTYGVKQRLLVAYYRSNPSSSEQFDLLVDVMKKASSKEELFGRIMLNKGFVNNVLLVLRTDVLFSDEDQLMSYEFIPRGIRASSYQRAFLAVCLFFAPTLLHSEHIIMRQIVDTFFAEEWVVHLHMGMLMNMVDAWDRYKAANNALQHALSVPVLKQLTLSHISKLDIKFFPNTAKSTVTDVVCFAGLIAAANKHLKWIMLHTYKPEKCCKRATQLYEIVNSQVISYSFDLFNTLLALSMFEYGYMETARSLLNNKEENVRKLKKELCQYITQIAELFGNELPLQKIKKNEKLRSWLLLLIKTIEEVDICSPDAPAVISELKSRLDQVSDMHDLAGIVAISQYLQKTQTLLTELSHYCIFDEVFLKKVGSAMNFSYGWIIIDQWAGNMESLVKKDPIPVRSLFVKLANSIKLALGRLHTNEKASSISLCYSCLIESKLRKILQAVPRSLFSLLAKITELLNPPQGYSINKSSIRQFMDPERRLQLAATTHAISMLSFGISTMQLTLLGSLQVDPSHLLLDGIRKELVNRICSTLHSLLASDFVLDDLLAKLKNEFVHLRAAFIYMCEHIAINGAVIWHNELARVIGYMVEKECNSFLRHPIGEDESFFQSRIVPIQVVADSEGSLTPLHRLYSLIVSASDPKSSYFLNSVRIWCDMKTKRTVLSKEFLIAIQEALSPMALHALDRITSFHIVKHLYTLCEQLSQITCPVMSSLLKNVASVNSATTAGRMKIFENAVVKFSSSSSRFISAVSKIGQLQLLRQQIVDVNQSVLQQRSFNIFSAVATLNNGIISDIHDRHGQCDTALLRELSILLERCAITDPFVKIYIRREAPLLLVPTMFLILLTAITKFNILKKIDSTDVSAFCAGFACVLQQFNCIHDFFVLCGTYTSSRLLTSRNSKQPTVLPAARFIAQYLSMSPEDVEKYLVHC